MSKYRRRECRSIRLFMVWNANSSSVPVHVQQCLVSSLRCMHTGAGQSFPNHAGQTCEHIIVQVQNYQVVHSRNARRQQPCATHEAVNVPSIYAVHERVSQASLLIVIAEQRCMRLCDIQA